jgi:N-acetylglucosamine-6-phosphate deacetylase
MTRLLLQGGRLVDPERHGEGEPRPGSLLVEDGRIVARFEADDAAELDAERCELAGAWLAPGFIDVHHHGELAFVGADDAAAATERASVSNARHGTTAFLATTVALPERRLGPLIAALSAALESVPAAGAQPIGIHLEGPWIDPGSAGAQPPAGIRPPDPGEVRSLLEASRGAIRLATLAPELDGADELLRALAAEGVVPAIGHSRAGREQIGRAIELGLRHVTHLFNAMSPLDHRELGVAGVALTDDRLTCDLIADGAHVHPAAVRLAARAKRDRLLLVTDRLDLPEPGRSLPEAMPSALRSDGVALRMPDGRLAGSCLRLDQAVRNMTQWAAMTRVEAIAACTLRPAKLLGLESERGTLRPGARADLIVLDPGDLTVRETWVGGRRVHPS